MDTVHKEVLDIHHDRLVTSLRANDVIDRLLKENAINKYDYDQLKRTEAQGGRAMNRLLLLTLRRRGEEAFPALQRSLLGSGQKELHDLLRGCELDLLEGVLTERLQRSVDVGSFELNGLGNIPGLDLGADTHGRLTPADSPRSESPVPVLLKASSPALKTSPTPRKSPKSRSPRPGGSSSPSPSSKERDKQKDRQLKELEEEVQELRRSYGKMETELKQQIEQLEKEKEKEAGGKKKDGGCAVM